MNSETKTCQNCKKDFVVEPEDFDFYAKIAAPAPTWCPACRLQRRMLWRNERFLYRRQCGKTGNEIFSTYPPESRVNAWEVGEWYKDDWDQLETGRDYDWSTPFFTQFARLMEVAPIASRAFNQPMVNSDYCNNVSYLKNCYLVFGAVSGEDCAYSQSIARCKNSLDCSFCSDSDLCYEGFFNYRCYRAQYSSHCEDCSNIVFCADCVGCSDCLGCVGLKNKKFHIFNVAYSKTEYEAKLAEYRLGQYGTLEKFRKEFLEFRKKFPVRFQRIFKSESSEGEYITNSRNVRKSYYIDGGENLKYCHSLYAKPTKDCYDQYRYGENCELMYECNSSGGHSSRCRFCYQVYRNCLDVQYSFLCTNVSRCFGCVGLHNKEYCILNKQYSKEEYEQLVPKIIKHMNEMPYRDAAGRVFPYGEYFPPELSPISYDKSIASEYFPLSPDAIRVAGFRHYESGRKNYSATKNFSELPDNIADTTDEILQEVISCEHRGKECGHGCADVFRFIPDELNFYRRLGIPIPRLCQDCRYGERMSARAPIKTWARQCACLGNVAKSPDGENLYENTATHSHKTAACSNAFETSYSPDRPEIVYCESCYQAEVA